jgi:hypothetical protein
MQSRDVLSKPAEFARDPSGSAFNPRFRKRLTIRSYQPLIYRFQISLRYHAKIDGGEQLSLRDEGDADTGRGLTTAQ